MNFYRYYFEVTKINGVKYCQTIEIAGCASDAALFLEIDVIYGDIEPTIKTAKLIKTVKL